MKPASSRAGTLVSLGLAALAALVLASAAASRGADGPALDVTFFTDGTISLTLPDGTPVGTTSGAPTVIPAGYYTLLLAGPGGCSELPYFELHGPGENILNDMDLGEMKATATAYFQPNSTYTWRDNGIPGVIYTFTTSSTDRRHPARPRARAVRRLPPRVRIRPRRPRTSSARRSPRSVAGSAPSSPLRDGCRSPSTARASRGSGPGGTRSASPTGARRTGSRSRSRRERRCRSAARRSSGSDRCRSS